MYKVRQGAEIPDELLAKITEQNREASFWGEHDGTTSITKPERDMVVDRRFGDYGIRRWLFDRRVK